MGRSLGGAVEDGAVAKKGAEYEAAISLGIVGLFTMVAVATGHEHWLKDPEEVMPMTAPLVRMVKEMPKSTLKKIEKSINPALFLAGCCVVVGPDVLIEAKIRANKKLVISEEAKAQFRTREHGGAADRSDSQASSGQSSSNGFDIIAPPRGLSVNPIQ